MATPIPEPPPSTPEDCGDQLVNTAISFIVVSTVFVGLRYVSRYLKRAKTGADDFLVPIAWLFEVGLCASSILMVKMGGVGRHMGWLMLNDPNAPVTFTKLQIPFTLLYALAVNFPKLAILGLYLRIFAKRSHRIACYILIAILSAACLAVVLTTCLQCMPLAFMWNPAAHPDGRCININTFWRWGSFPNIVTDVLMIILPLPCIWSLKLSMKDKIGLVLTFGTGSVGLVTSVVRFTLFFQTDGLADATWTAVKLGSISCTEPGVYLMAACLPTYRSLWTSIRTRSTFSGSRSNKTDPNATLQGSDRNIHLISVQSKQRRVFGTGSMDEFERLENDERTLISGNHRSHYDDFSDRETGSVNSARHHQDRGIHVHRDYNVSTTHARV